MAKRYTDSAKWQHAWFCGLAEKEKLFWLYLLDNCDHAGIWEVNWSLVKFHIKNFVFKKENFAEKIVEISSTKWFIKNFVDFQYGELNEENRVHKSVLKILEKEGASKPLTSPLLGLKDKDKDNNKGPEPAKIVNNNNTIDINVHEQKFEQVWALYPSRVGKKRAYAHYMSSVKTPKDEADIKIALNNYSASKRVKGGYVQNGDTWFNNWRDWVNYVEPQTEKDKDDAIRKRIGLPPR